MGELDDRWHRNFNASQNRLGLKERAVAFLGGKCAICGYDKCPSAFDFHHLDSSEKDFEISAKMTWDAALEAELQKCALLCSNCHREVHAGWHPSYLTLDEGNEPDFDEVHDEAERRAEERYEASRERDGRMLMAGD